MFPLASSKIIKSNATIMNYLCSLKMKDTSCVIHSFSQKGIFVTWFVWLAVKALQTSKEQFLSFTRCSQQWNGRNSWKKFLSIEVFQFALLMNFGCIKLLSILVSIAWFLQWYFDKLRLFWGAETATSICIYDVHDFTNIIMYTEYVIPSIFCDKVFVYEYG